MNFSSLKSPIDKTKNYIYYQNFLPNDNNQENMNIGNYQNSDLKNLKSENRKNKQNLNYM
jgi:hypothetical protein